MIPLRDANPTRRTPVVTIGLVAACLIAFAWELGLQVSGGDEALDAFITTWGIVPADLTRGLGDVGVPERRDADARHQPVPPRRLVAPRGQPPVPVDLRQQHRGRSRPAGVPGVLPRRRRDRRPDPGRDRPDIDGADDRGVWRDRRRPRRLPRALSRGPGSPRSCSWASSTSSSTSRRSSSWVLVRAPADRRAGLARLRRGRRAVSRSSPTSAGSWPASSQPGSSSWLRHRRRGGSPSVMTPWDNPGHAGRVAGRDGRGERAGPHAVEPPRGHPQGDRPRPVPADLDRPVGSQRDRDETPGPDPRTTVDPRPVRVGPRGSSGRAWTASWSSR